MVYVPPSIILVAPKLMLFKLLIEFVGIVISAEPSKGIPLIFLGVLNLFAEVAVPLKVPVILLAVIFVLVKLLRPVTLV